MMSVFLSAKQTGGQIRFDGRPTLKAPGTVTGLVGIRAIGVNNHG